MEMKIHIPFQQLLTAVKSLTNSQKAKLKRELDENYIVNIEKNEFVELLLNGPVYNEEEINIIEENRKSISAWRTKK